ncbi:DUF309 domain-containing protein [Roseobacter sinensis]|uniref:DUF309 domain-containing protein n=1 Tax=Roseobacter sinensis TaxID=2931391 RepID=A0ABT3BDW2_9RHOB|nr:DUF309 domain-containing protein [Roseobacter sp. WL0113]MCV3271755.1 DUF309 domain-containing protein [Roseobacter sp. WL0113]
MLRWPELSADLRPPHAYVPGRTARHPEGWFDHIKASAQDTATPDALRHTAAFRTGLAYLGAGYFWECHEVLEAIWLRTPDPSPERELVQALIQLANARLKLAMRRPKAAGRLCDMSAAHLSRCAGQATVLGVGIVDLQAEVDQTRYDLNMHYKL